MTSTPTLEALVDFTLPPDLEAHAPPEARGLARDEVRLLVSDRRGNRMVHSTFRDLPWFLDPGDLLVVNDSETLPAALTARLEDGREVALHLSTRLSRQRWIVEPRKVALAAGAVLALPAGGRARLLHPHRGSSRLWVARLSLPRPALSYIRRHGRPVTYDYLHGAWPVETYQTVYARPRRDRGSAEMPSAGRPLSLRLLTALEVRGVEAAAVTLHTGVASLESHEPPYEEWFEVSPEAVDAVRAARARDGRVVAVGTTVVRALESAVGEDGEVRPARGWTDLIITPERGVRSVDGMLTGFHEPRASHLQMLAALASPQHLRIAYERALAEGYLWHEFGDMQLIL